MVVSNVLQDLASYLHPKGKRRGELTEAQRWSVYRLCDGAASAEADPQGWPRVIYSSDASLERAWRHLTTICPHLLQTAQRSVRQRKR